MPIYEYQCQACAERLEILQGMSDPPLTTCPECGGDLKKLVSAPAFQFKGSGWYVTDYARQGNGSKDGEAKPAEAKSDSGGKSDSGSKADSNGSKESAKPSPSGNEKAAKSAAG